MINSSGCKGCTACLHVCPADAISIEEDTNGFPRAVVDKDRCDMCGACDSVCVNGSAGAGNPILHSCWAYNENLDMRLNSASGGVFGALAQAVLRRGGIVYGAAFDEVNEVRHMMIEDEEQLPCLMGSKYVQSSLGTTFSDAANQLLDSRLVLFSGTPCQVTGLKKYLMRDYQNLITVGVICHGVASRGLWKNYLQLLSGKRCQNVSQIRFRDKATGWHRPSFSYRRNNRKHTCMYVDDPFCFLYIHNYTLRPECFHCHHSRNVYDSDLTLGDFWGVEKFKECHDDNKGTSIILVHTEKGGELLRSCAGLNMKQISTEDALKYNLHEPPQKPDDYDEFWKCYHESGLSACIRRYCYATGLRRVKIIVKNILLKLKLIKFFR